MHYVPVTSSKVLQFVVLITMTNSYTKAMKVKIKHECINWNHIFYLPLNNHVLIYVLSPLSLFTRHLILIAPYQRSATNELRERKSIYTFLFYLLY